jgi:hypothetical protein
MSKYECHFCDEWNGLILLLSGEYLCPRCATSLGYFTNPIPIVSRIDLKDIESIDIHQSLDEITCDLITFFVKNGMTISDVARQLGITRATVYAKLRRAAVC